MDPQTASRTTSRPANDARANGSWKPIAGVALGAFAFGAVLVGYLTWDGPPWSVDSLGALVASDEGETTPEAPVAAPIDNEAQDLTGPAQIGANSGQDDTAVERVEEQQGGLDQRLAAAEQRLARLDLQAQAASGNAARAEGLLIAFAARRSLERGAELGYLADQLRLRFSDALPNAVNTIISVSRDPITVDQLTARLETLGPELAETRQEPSFDRFRRELGELFIIRRESAPSPQPQRRLERARLFLQSGRVGPAIEEVRQLPGADSAKRWIANAERYAAAQRALDLIETSAVVEPRRLRDGEGERVEQPAPGRENLIR